jgi:hypothetical protein
MDKSLSSSRCKPAAGRRAFLCACAILCWTGGVAPSAAAGSFVVSSTTQTGDGPHSVIASRFDDLSGGNIDIAVANALGDQIFSLPDDRPGDIIFMLRGDGFGGFRQTQNGGTLPMFTGNSPVALAAPRSCDGQLIVSANKFSDDISIFTPQRTDTSIIFTRGPQPSAPTDGKSGPNAIPVALAVADFNNDGLDEVFVANEASSTLRYLEQTGCAQFTPRQDVAAPDSVSLLGIAAVDADGSGFRDIVTVARGPVPSGPGGAAAPRTGRLNTFLARIVDRGLPTERTELSTTPSGFALPAGSRSVAVGNFNGDLMGAANDLAIANEYSDSVTIAYRNPSGNGFLGNQTDTLTAPNGAPPGSCPPEGCQGPSFVLAGDFNGDPYTDLAVAFLASDQVAIYLNRDLGVPPTAPPSTARARLPSTPDQLISFPAVKTGPGGQPLSIECSRPVSMVGADFDNDGDTDIAVACLNSDKLVLLENE